MILSGKKTTVFAFALLSTLGLMSASNPTDNDVRFFLKQTEIGDCTKALQFIEKHEPEYLSMLVNLPSDTSPKPLTFLHIACAMKKSENGCESSYDVVEGLLQKGCSSLINTPDYEGETPFTLAYKNDNLLTAHYLIENGASVTVANKKGSTVLLHLVKNNDQPVIQKYLGIEPHIIKTTFSVAEKYTELLEQIKQLNNEKSSHLKLLTTLLYLFYGNYADSSLNQLACFTDPETGNTLLHEAILHDFPEAILLLLNFNADPLALNADNENALTLAIKEKVFDRFLLHIKNHMQLLRKPMDTGKNTILHFIAKNSVTKDPFPQDFVIPLQTLCLKNKKEETPFTLAIKTKNLPMIARIIKARVPLYTPTAWELYREELYKIVESKTITNPKSPEKWLSFEWLAEKLKKHPINSAPQKTSCLIDIKTFEQLIKHDETLIAAFQENKILYNPLVPTRKLKRGLSDSPLLGSLLHQACYLGDLERVKLIIEHGGNPSLQDSCGNTLLHITVQEEHTDLVKYLLNKEVPFLYNSNKQTPLHIACRRKNKELVELLLKNEPKKYGLIINKEENETYPSAFSITCQEGNPEILEILLKNGAFPDGTQEAEAVPPLFHAFKNNQLHIVKKLIEEGASPEIKDPYGLTLLNYLCIGDGFQSPESTGTTINDLALLLKQKGALKNTIFTPSEGYYVANRKKTNYELAQQYQVTYLVNLFDQQGEHKQ